MHLLFSICSQLQDDDQVEDEAKIPSIVSLAATPTYETLFFGTNKGGIYDIPLQVPDEKDDDEKSEKGSNRGSDEESDADSRGSRR